MATKSKILHRWFNGALPGHALKHCKRSLAVTIANPWLLSSIPIPNTTSSSKYPVFFDTGPSDFLPQAYAMLTVYEKQAQFPLSSFNASVLSSQFSFGENPVAVSFDISIGCRDTPSILNGGAADHTIKYRS